MPEVVDGSLDDVRPGLGKFDDERVKPLNFFRQLLNRHALREFVRPVLQWLLSLFPIPFATHEKVAFRRQRRGVEVDVPLAQRRVELAIVEPASIVALLVAMLADRGFKSVDLGERECRGCVIVGVPDQAPRNHLESIHVMLGSPHD
jgi:hypothetical protein